MFEIVQVSRENIPKGNFYEKNQMIANANCLIWRENAKKKILAGNGGFRRVLRFRRCFFTVPYCSPHKQLLCQILEL